VSAEFPEHRLLVPAAAVGNSYIPACLDSVMIATELWSGQIKINTKSISFLLSAEKAVVLQLAKISIWTILEVSDVDESCCRSQLMKLETAVFLGCDIV
jgi:hypothetical protein